MSKVHLNFPALSPEEKKKRRGRPFEPGNTIGKGRPKGSVNKMTQRAKEIWNEYAEEIAENTAIMARAGDQVGLSVYWSRVFPVRAGAPVEFDMPPVLTADDVAPAFNAVMQGVANGEPTPAEGVEVTRILEAQAKVVAFQFGAPWQPDTKALIDRVTQMREEAAAARPEEAA